MEADEEVGRQEQGLRLTQFPPFFSHCLLGADPLLLCQPSGAVS